MATAHVERYEFSVRLRKALRDAGYSQDSPTDLSRLFNAHSRAEPLTVHAARKWIMGEAIPTQDKLRTLAKLLRVDMSWLRFGTPAGAPSDDEDVASMSRADLRLLDELRRLPEHEQDIVRDFVRMLARKHMKQVA